MDAVQQPGYIYICENTTSHKGGKIQAPARRDPNAPPAQNPAGRKELERGGSKSPGLLNNQLEKSAPRAQIQGAWGAGY